LANTEKKDVSGLIGAGKRFFADILSGLADTLDVLKASSLESKNHLSVHDITGTPTTDESFNGSTLLAWTGTLINQGAFAIDTTMDYRYRFIIITGRMISNGNGNYMPGQVREEQIRYEAEMQNSAVVTSRLRADFYSAGGANYDAITFPNVLTDTKPFCFVQWEDLPETTGVIGVDDARRKPPNYPRVFFWVDSLTGFLMCMREPNTEFVPITPGQLNDVDINVLIRVKPQLFDPLTAPPPPGGYSYGY